MAESKLSIYIETTVWSFAIADDVPDYRAYTEEFLEPCRCGVFHPFISTLVLDEISRADSTVHANLEQLVAKVRPTVFTPSERSLALADAFLAARVVPPSMPDDAGHVAAAFDQRLDILVSWNFRHIANVRRAERFNAVAVLEGYNHALRIVSPAEVLYAEDDK
jgi:hypothetical protein